MKVSKIYYNFLKQLGYKEVFGLPGSYIMPIWQEFGEDIKIVLSRHENGAVFMADGWARNNSLPGIVLTTIGPGLTNAITGITCAYQDSVPLIIISGYVPTTMNGKGCFQNSDKNDRGFMPEELLSSITKATFLPQTADEAVKMLGEAYSIAMSGRKGPVHISMPMDIPNMESDVEVQINIDTSVKDIKLSDKFEKLVANSKRPIFFVGNGCFLANATEELNEVSKKYNIPIVSSIKGTSACTIENKRYLGITGNVIKDKLSKYLKQYDADLVIALGSSLSVNSCKDFEDLFGNAKIIRVDIDENQFNNYRQADVNIKMDVKDFLEQMNHLDLQKKENNIDFKIDEEIPSEEDNMFSKVADYMYRNTSENTLFIPDAGNHWLDILYWCYPKQRLGILTNAGLASMGHAIGASIGLKIANKEKNVICITGDGSFMMSGMEISEAISQKLDITFIIVNNSSLGRARIYQEMTDGKVISTTFKDSNFACITRALGAKAKSAYSLEEFKDIFETMKNETGVKVIEVVVETQDCPKSLRRE